MDAVILALKFLISFVIVHGMSWGLLFAALSIDPEPPKSVTNVMGGGVWLSGIAIIGSLFALMWSF